MEAGDGWVAAGVVGGRLTRNVFLEHTPRWPGSGRVVRYKVNASLEKASTYSTQLTGWLDVQPAAVPEQVPW